MQRRIFTRGRWPSDIVRAFLCLSITSFSHDNSSSVQARISKLGPEVQNALVKHPIVLWGDWPWPTRLNSTLTQLQNQNSTNVWFIHQSKYNHLCSLRCLKRSVCLVLQSLITHLYGACIWGALTSSVCGGVGVVRDGGRGHSSPVPLTPNYWSGHPMVFWHLTSLLLRPYWRWQPEKNL